MFTNARLFTKKSLLTPGLTVHLLVVTNISCQNYNWSTADTEATTNSSRYHDSNICSVDTSAFWNFLLSMSFPNRAL